MDIRQFNHKSVRWEFYLEVLSWWNTVCSGSHLRLICSVCFSFLRSCAITSRSTLKLCQVSNQRWLAERSVISGPRCTDVTEGRDHTRLCACESPRLKWLSDERSPLIKPPRRVFFHGGRFPADKPHRHHRFLITRLRNQPLIQITPLIPTTLT